MQYIHEWMGIRRWCALQHKLAVDMGMWGGLVPDNAGDAKQLGQMWDLGVLGFKSFMPPSGLLTSHHDPRLPQSLCGQARLGS